jgi:cell division protein DivIC
MNCSLTKLQTMKLLNHIPAWLRNKYFVAISVFAVIMLFLDKNDIYTQMAWKKELRDLQQSKKRYTQEISELSAIKASLEKDPRTIEKYARENYLMKRDNEDLFIISEKSDTGPARSNN